MTKTTQEVEYPESDMLTVWLLKVTLRIQART